MGLLSRSDRARNTYCGIPEESGPGLHAELQQDHRLCPFLLGLLLDFGKLNLRLKLYF
jgi:hypothetical protein